ncbi:hypothetical protein RB597_010274 [Gaeumannomyces tritici]
MADEFWASLTGQLGLFMKDRGRFLEQYGRNLDWCLPQLLKAVKEIIQTMIAVQDCELPSEVLDVELRIQEFCRGILNLETLASWLSSILKLHCAPTRDEWVDEMYRKLSDGSRKNDIRLIVQGMRSLLGVLEAMKLDVANHIIRSLRERIIDDTVNFLQRHFRGKLQVDFDIADAKTWYWNASRQYSAISTTPETRQGLGDMAVFFYGLSAMVLPTRSATILPSTFIFDKGRLQKLRSDAMDAVCLNICMEYQLNSAPEAAGESIKSAVYASLVALLRTIQPAVSPQEKWQILVPKVAVEIRLFNKLPEDMLPYIEQNLWSRLQTNVFVEAEKSFHQDLFGELADRVCKFRNLSELDLFSTATGNQLYSVQDGAFETKRLFLDGDAAAPGQGPSHLHGVENMATRLAHLGLLHWRVWADIAYVEA